MLIRCQDLSDILKRSLCTPIEGLPAHGGAVWVMANVFHQHACFMSYQNSKPSFIIVRPRLKFDHSVVLTVCLIFSVRCKCMSADNRELSHYSSVKAAASFSVFTQRKPQFLTTVDSSLLILLPLWECSRKESNTDAAGRQIWKL